MERKVPEDLMETILVTGAGGFIGSNLVESQLELGKKVKAYDLNLDKLSHLKSKKFCELIIGDVRDTSKLGEIIQGTDIVFHLASAHLEVAKSTNYYYETNVDAVLSLVRIAHLAKVKRFVHCSSVGVYGKLENLPADENTACHPEILYEKTKLAGERAVMQYCHETGFPVVVLRPAWVYGPRCPRTLKLFRTIKKGKFFMVGDGNNFRHPIFIGDMVAAFDLAGKQENIAGEIFIIASEKPVRLKKLIALVAENLNVSQPAFKIPLSIMKIICWLVEVGFNAFKKEPPFSSRSLKFFTESSCFDIAKAKKLLSFAPKIDLKEGIAETHSAFKDNGLL